VDSWDCGGGLLFFVFLILRFSPSGFALLLSLLEEEELETGRETASVFADKGVSELAVLADNPFE